jgi:LCP family protein required for cell wall assembly
VLCCIAFVAAAIAGALFASSSLLDKPLEKAAEDGMLTAHDKSTIMIMGVDERDDDVGRSDTLMIATLDPKKDQAALLSIPRDTRVKIKGHGYDKINAAYAYGGHKLTQNTVEGLLGVPMDHYVLINIKAFTRIIDALGGIDINVEKRMHYEDPWDDDGGLVINLFPGQQHMDGKTAVTYVRYRDEEGDIGRIGRQQKFMKAVMDKVTSPSIITKLPSIIREIMSSVKTDLSFRQLLEFAGTLKEAQKNGLKTDMVPGKPLYIQGVSYWIPDIKQLRHTLADTLGVTMNSSMTAAMERQADEYAHSIPANATAVPSSDTSVGHAKSSKSSASSRSSSAGSSRSGNSSSRSSDSSAPAATASPSGTSASGPSGTSRSPAPSPSQAAASGGKTQ